MCTHIHVAVYYISTTTVCTYSTKLRGGSPLAKAKEEGAICETSTSPLTFTLSSSRYNAPPAHEARQEEGREGGEGNSLLKGKEISLFFLIPKREGGGGNLYYAEALHCTFLLCAVPRGGNY